MTSEFLKNTIINRLHQEGEEIADVFYFGEYIDKPNTKGVFQIQNKGWFIYESDERNAKSITGPFGDDDIIYACAKLLHKSKYFAEYRFSNKAKEIYIHVHYRSVTEAEQGR